MVYECSSGNTYKNHGEPLVKFEKRKGFSNPYYHLHTCISGSSDVELTKIYETALDMNRQRGISFGPDSTLLRRLKQKERDIYRYMRFIVKKYSPVSYVEDPEVRRFSEI